jgi:hypothetical protein
MLSRLPAWALAGALMGLGSALLWSALRRRPPGRASPDSAAVL